MPEVNLNRIKMNNYKSLIILIYVAIIFSGCEIIGGIFKAGVWVGIFIVLAIIALIAWLINKAKK